MTTTKKVLITGGAGFIGSHLSKKLAQDNWKVVIIDRNRLDSRAKNIKSYGLTVSDPRLKTVFQKEQPILVYYLSGPIRLRKSISDPAFTKSINILGDLLNTLESARLSGVKKFVFISSGGSIVADARLSPTPESYPCQPQTLYGIANLLLEKCITLYSQTYNLPCVIIRLGNVYGPGQWSSGVIPSMIRTLATGERFVMNGDGQQIRDFVFIDDVIHALRLVASSKKNDIYNVGSGKGIRLRDLLKEITRLLHAKANIKFTKNQNDAKRSVLDISKIKKDFAWDPQVNLETGLKKTIAWYTKQDI